MPAAGPRPPAGYPPNATMRLPAPLDRWVLELLGALPPAESQATCSACVMQRPVAHTTSVAEADGVEPIYFDPVSRCCTYQPHLPNYLVGAALAQDGSVHPHGQASVRARIAGGHATPLGVRVEPTYQLIYHHAMAPSFGRARSMRCPHHLDDGGCGLWAQRPAVCATWFCKHDRGAVGATLWRTLYQLMSAAERVASLWCAGQLGLPASNLRDTLEKLDAPVLDPATVDARPADLIAAQAAAWGSWAGREEAYYRACHDAAVGLGWPEIEREGGGEFRLLAEAAREAAARHADLQLPERVRLGRFQVVGTREGRVWLQGYSEFDPLAVGAEVLTLLGRCDGRPWSVIVDAHVADGHPRPTRWLLRTLLDHGLLQAA